MYKTAINLNREKFSLPLYTKVMPGDIRASINNIRRLMRQIEKSEKAAFNV